MAESQKVLVIDDDEVVLVAMADLLEEAGFRVVTQASPIGATQVIAREGIDAAVIDVNLPIMQGDKVVRLLQSWDRVQDLALVIISGASDQKLAAIHAQLPDVKIIPKTRMQDDLVGAVRSALSAKIVRSTGRSAAVGQGRATELVARFTESLSETMAQTLTTWRSLPSAPAANRDALQSRLSTLQGQAQLLGLERAAQLLSLLSEALRSLRADRPLSQLSQHALESAMSGLAGLKRSATGEFVLSPDPLLRGVSHALTELRSR